MTMKEAIQRMVAEKIKATVLVAKVKSFQASDWTIVIDIENKTEVDGVRIRSVINSDSKGIMVEPKVGSYVLVGLIDNRIESLFVVGYSEIVKYHLNADTILLNGDTNGGLVKSEVVSNEIQGIKDEINNLKTILSAWVPVPSDGGAVLKAALSGFYTPIAPTLQAQYENNTVSHGE